jgi:hypothetical protein
MDLLQAAAPSFRNEPHLEIRVTEALQDCGELLAQAMNVSVSSPTALAV